jgi:hypothetical protein
MTPEQIAEVAHEANRAVQRINGETYVDPPWSEASEERRARLTAVVARGPAGTPRASHEVWFREKLADGWAYGPTRDNEAKIHPCMVPYDDLPESQRAKDALFLGILRALGPQEVFPVKGPFDMAY